MPKETKDAILWALTQEDFFGDSVTLKSIFLVDKVQEYFHDNNIDYKDFDRNSLIPFIEELEDEGKI